MQSSASELGLSLYFCKVRAGKMWTKTFKYCPNILKFHNVIKEKSSEKSHSQWPRQSLPSFFQESLFKWLCEYTESQKRKKHV